MNQEKIGDKGKKVYEKIEEAKNIFFEDLGVQVINTECNKLRSNFIDAVEHDQVFGFSYSKKQFLDELKLPFELKDPREIEMELLDSEYVDPCMETHYWGNYSSLSFKIRVYLVRIKEEDSEFVWDSPLVYYRFNINNGFFKRADEGKKFAVRTVAFHEFLHTCGEIPLYGRPKNDIRTNFIGLNAILGLLEKKSNSV
jgi:hypothetical protein